MVPQPQTVELEYLPMTNQRMFRMLHILLSLFMIPWIIVVKRYIIKQQNGINKLPHNVDNI